MNPKCKVYKHNGFWLIGRGDYVVGMVFSTQAKAMEYALWMGTDEALS